MKLSKKLKKLKNVLLNGSQSAYIVESVVKFLKKEFSDEHFTISVKNLKDSIHMSFYVDVDQKEIVIEPFICNIEDATDKVIYKEYKSFKVIFKSENYRKLAALETNTNWELKYFEQKKEQLSEFELLDLTIEDKKYWKALMDVCIMNINISKYNTKVQALMDNNLYGQKIRDILRNIHEDDIFYNMVELELPDGKYEEMMMHMMMNHVWVHKNIPSFDGISLFADVGIKEHPILNRTASSEFSRNVENLIEKSRVIPPMFEVNDESNYNEIHLYFSVNEFTMNLNRQYKLLEINMNEILFNLWKVYSIINLKCILGEEICK